MVKLFKIFLLPFRKQKILGQSLFLVGFIRLSLWVFPFRKLNKWLSGFRVEGQSETPTDWSLIKMVVRSVRTCSRYVPSASCLTQALAARTLLRLKGQKSALKIGVDKDENGKLTAHAWLEVEGRIIIGKLSHHQRYSVLDSSDSVAI